MAPASSLGRCLAFRQFVNSTFSRLFMWFTKNFRALWWFFLIVLLSIFIFHRFSSLTRGDAKAIDFLIFIVWTGVCLGPLFAEIQLPGITLKQKIEDTKKELSKDIDSLRSEIRNSIEIRSQVSPSVWIGTGFQEPTPDNKLKDVEQRLHSAINRLENQGYQLHSRPSNHSSSTLSEHEMILFSTRRDIEVELRAIVFTDRFNNRYIPIGRVLEELVANELADQQMADVIRELYSICSRSIHGEKASEAQVEFVKRNGPELISALRAIRYNAV